MNKTITLILAIALLFASWSIDASADNLIVNGSFETGDFTGWTATNNTDINGVDNNSPHSGTYDAHFGQLTADGQISISQSIATIPGQTYTFSFWLMADQGSGFSGAPNKFRASFNGKALLDLVNVSKSRYKKYIYTVTAASTSSLVQFDAANDSAFFELDDVRLTPTRSKK